MIYSIALVDYGGAQQSPPRAIGQVLIWQDQSERLQSVYHNHLILAGLTIVIFVILEFCIYWAIVLISKSLQQQVQKSTYKLNQAQKLARFGYWDMELQNQRMSCSAEMFRILELNPKQIQANLLSLLERVHPQDREAVENSIMQALQQLPGESLKYRLLFDNQRIKYLQQKSYTEEDAQTQAVRCIFIVQDRSEEESAEQRRKAHEKTWISALENSGHGICEWHPQSGQLQLSERWKAMLGYRQDEIHSSLESWQKLIHADDREAVHTALQQHFLGQSPVYRSEHRMRHADGHNVWVLDQGMVIERDENGKATRLLVSQTDISQAHQMQKALEDEHRNLRALLENTTEAYLALDKDNNVTYFNLAAEKLWQIPRQSIEGHNLWDALPELASMFYKSFARVHKCGESIEIEGQYPPLNLHLEVHLHPWNDGLWLFAQDITERKNNQQQLEFLATHDGLTGLFNRSKFMALLNKEQMRADRYESSYSLIMLDIDHFKRINDQLGHAAGDEVLKQVVDKTRSQLRYIDSLSRWGGEEFMILMPETDLHGAGVIAERCRLAVTEVTLNHQGHVSISLGVVEHRSGESLDALLERVDTLLYQAKQTGRDRVVMGES